MDKESEKILLEIRMRYSMHVTAHGMLGMFGGAMGMILSYGTDWPKRLFDYGLITTSVSALAVGAGIYISRGLQERLDSLEGTGLERTIERAKKEITTPRSSS